ncbi:hypothetical protein NEIG_01045 [Nematocida sp. ERTm5]|nr:hypothetical protein NEIG_01045 [Nematocida sp. ERTm5]
MDLCDVELETNLSESQQFDDIKSQLNYFWELYGLINCSEPSIDYHYLHNLMRQYALIELENIKQFYFKRSSPITRISNILNKTYKENYITRAEIFMCGSIEDVSYRCLLIQRFLILTSGIRLDANNEMVQMTANILSSIPLDDLKIRHELIRILVINKNSRKYYPMFKYDLQELPPVNSSSIEICDIAGLICMLNPPANAMFASLKAILKMYCYTEGASILFSKKYTKLCAFMNYYKEGWLDGLGCYN